MDKRDIDFIDAKLIKFWSDFKDEENARRNSISIPDDELHTERNKEYERLYKKIEKILGQADHEFTWHLLFLLDSLDHDLTLPSNAEVKAELEKFRQAINTLAPFLKFQELENTWRLNSTMKKQGQISFFNASIYSSILLSAMREGIDELIPKIPKDKKGRKDNPIDNLIKSHLLGYIYQYVTDHYKQQDIEKREKENTVRSVTAQILSVCKVHIPGADLKTKCSKDRFWKEIKKGINAKRERDKDIENIKNLHNDETEENIESGY